MSTLKVNNLQDINGGNNSTPEQVLQGRAKAWIHFSANDNSIRDSFNISSIDDLGTGAHRINFTNSFANKNYCAVSMSGEFANLLGNNPERIPRVSNFNTGSIIYCNRTATGGSGDDNYQGLAIFGDQ